MRYIYEERVFIVGINIFNLTFFFPLTNELLKKDYLSKEGVSQ